MGFVIFLFLVSLNFSPDQNETGAGEWGQRSDDRVVTAPDGRGWCIFSPRYSWR
jgi:hypothetical protein